MNNRAGILIVVLWTLSILSSLAIILGQRISSELKIVKRIQDRIKITYIAKAAVNTFAAKIKIDETENYDGLEDKWFDNEEYFKDIEVGEGRFSIKYKTTGLDGEEITMYGVRDEESKLNINYAASADVLITLINNVVSDEADANAVDIASAIWDWKDKEASGEEIVTGNGAENSYYQNLDPPYECKDASFESLEELLLVKGMTPEILSELKDYITVYSSGAVNINTAGFEVLSAICGDDGLASTIMQYRQYHPFESTSSILSELQSQGITEDDAAVISGLVSNGRLTTKSDNFMLNIHSELNAHRTAMDIKCITDRNGYIKYWRQL